MRAFRLSILASRLKTGGFTLVEALSTLCIFGFFVTVLFLTIHWGFRSFSLAVAKSDVTTEARRMALFIERELRSSNYFSITTVERSAGTERRDAICFVSRNDWASPEAYDQINAVPAWNRYFVYYATRTLPHGEFIRLSIVPDTPLDIGSFPYPKFTRPGSQNDYLRDDHQNSRPPDVESTRALASSVSSFQIKRLPTSQEVEMRLLLRQNGLMARRADGHREGGTFEVQYRVQPQNTL